MKNYVLGFMFSPSQRDVLLISKTKPDWQEGKLNGIGGMIEQPESGVAAMIREFKEETDICTMEDQWRQFATLNGKDYQVVCFKTKSDLIWEAKSITEEEVFQIQVDEFDKYDLVENVRWLVEMAMDNDSGNSFTAKIFYK